MKHAIHFPVGPASIKYDQQKMLFLRKQRISVGNIIRGVRVRVRVPESSGRNKRFSERIIGSYRYSRRKNGPLLRCITCRNFLRVEFQVKKALFLFGWILVQPPMRLVENSDIISVI